MSHWTYELQIVERPDEGDDRTWPDDSQTHNCLIEMGFPFREMAEQLMCGDPITVTLLAPEIVRFHHLRRSWGCCPRIKWRVLNDEDCPASWGTCER